MLDEIIDELKKYKGKVLIITHHNADIDAIASSIGLFHSLKHLGLEAKIGVPESVSKNARKAAKDYEIIIDPNCSEYNHVVLVETSVPEQVKSVGNLKVDMIIDHHPPGKLADSVKVKWIDPSFKSASEMIFKILKALDAPIDKNLAKILASGLIADTSFLRIADTDSLETLIELIKSGASIQESMNLISLKPDSSETIACFKAIRKIELFRIGELLVGFSKLSSHEAAASRMILRIGADIGIVAALKNKELRISSRAKPRILDYKIDLSEIFKEVGNMIDGSGGGHDLAGSANGKNVEAVDEIFGFILGKISKKVGKEFKKL